MAEPTTVPATPETGLTGKKPDWFVNSLQGNIPTSLNDMHAEGIYANDFSIDNPEAYWSKKSVQEAFTDPSTKALRKDLFDSKYKDILSLYKTHRETELNLVNMGASSPTITAERSGVRTPQPIVFETKEDPMGRNFASGTWYTDPFSSPTKTLKQTAIEQGVRQDDGTYVSAKDFKGQAKFAMGDKGGLLFNDQGKPYLVPIKDGEQLHGWDQVYNKNAENLGGYGIGYDLSNVAKSVIKNPINFISQSVDDLVEYGRGFMGLWGIESPEAEKKLTNVENWAKGIRTPVTEGNEGSFYNAENIIDLSQQVLWQLGTMAAVGGTVTALTKNPRVGSAAAKLFMTAISAGSIAEVARDNGLSKRESALMLGVLSGFYYPLMSLSEAAIGRLATRESRAALTDTVNKATNNGVLIKALTKNPTRAGLKTLFADMKEGVKSWSLRPLIASGVYSAERSAPALLGAASEAVEETAEQALDTGVRSLYNLYSYTADDSKHPFPIDWSNELAQWGQAATGGAIGGAAAHTLFTGLMKSHPQAAYDIHDAVMDGKEKVLRDFFTSMHGQGRLDHNWLTTEGKITDGKSSDSRNDQAYKVLNSLVDYLVQLRDSSGIGNMYRNNQQAASDLFSKTIEASSVGKEASELNANIQSLSAELEKAKASNNPNTEMISSLEDRLNASREQLQKIVSGEFVTDYVTQGLYNMNTIASGDPDFGKLDGRKFATLTNLFPESHKASQEAHSTLIDEQAQADKNATIDNPQGASDAKVQELLSQAQTEYSQAHKAISEHLEDMSSMEDEEGNPLVYPQNLAPTAMPELRTQEINALKNTVIPAKEAQEKAANTPHKVFVYGTLEDVATRKKALGLHGTDVKSTPATVRGNVTTDNTFPDFHPEGHQEIQGELLDVNEKQLKKLDNWEDKYNRREVTTSTGEKAYVYEEKTSQEKKDIAGQRRKMIAGSKALIASAEKLRRLESIKGNVLPEPPAAEAEFLKMVPEKPGIVHTGSIPEKINEELALREKSITGGVSLYSNSPQIQAIKSSIEQRLAQAKALLAVGQQINIMREQRGEEPLPQTNPDTLSQVIPQLQSYLGLANALLQESESNTASADMRIAKATISLIGSSMDYLNALSEASVGTEFAGVRDIVARYRPNINKAIEDSSVNDALQLLNKAESEIYDGFSPKRELILDALSKQQYSDFTRKVYDYSRGILTLSSGDFWNAYQATLVNSDPTIFSPSDEHSIIVKQAVQGLMASSYSPPSIGHPNRLYHHHSVFIEGRGGSGKTRSVIPLIVGTVQQLLGGKTFLIAASDPGDVKRNNLISSVENFFKVSDNQISVQLVNSQKSLLEFLQAPGATTDVNLIVYDEATLLSTDELAQAQLRLDQLNQRRLEENTPPLKIVYTGDTFQNSVGTDKSNPDTRAIGIDDTNRHLIQRTPSLMFSFRQTNQPLFLFSSYLESIQSETGTSRPFATSYSSREGVQIHQGYEEFVSNAATYLNTLSRSGRIHEAVYITDKPVTSIDQRILDSKVLVVSGEQAQGREWPIVFFDPQNDSLFTPQFKNLGVKKDYYTAATRASNYLLTHVIPGSGVTSVEGTVNKIRPLTSNTTRQSVIDNISKITGSSPVGPTAFDYDRVTVRASNPDFPMEDRNIQEEATTYDPMGQMTSEQEKIISSSPTQFNEALEATKTPLTDGAKLAGILQSMNRKGLVSMHTFFTHSLIEFEEQMELKRKAIYDPKVRRVTPYFVSINRIGSPGYDNILREDPNFTGSYGLFIEAEPGDKHVVLGIMSSPDLDSLIKELNLMSGRETLRIPISSDFLGEAENLGATVFNKTNKVQSVGSMKTVSKGIRFSTPYIVTLSSAEQNKLGEARSRAGEIFIPASFYYTSQDIDQVLRANNTSAYITKVPVRTRSVPFAEISDLLDRFVDDEGKFDFSAEDGLGGRMYDAFWSHNTESGTKATGEPRENRLSEALRSIRDKTSQNDLFRAFLDKYIEESVDPRAQDIIDTVAGGEDVELQPTSKVNANPRYFLKHYLEARRAGKPLTNFERAIEGLRNHPYFKRGFEFNPRISGRSTDPGVIAHAKARSLPDAIYDKYLEANLDYVSPPSIQIPLETITRSIQEASPVPMIIPPAIAPKSEPGGQSPTEYVEPTQSISAVEATEDTDPVSDSVEVEKAYEDDEIPGLESDSLELFQSRWFSLPGYSSMFPETVRTFKRGFMDYLFSTSAEDGAQPFLRDIGETMKTTSGLAKEIIDKWQQILPTLDPVRDQVAREQYIRYVKAREFRFLTQKYFPSIFQDPDTKEWRYRSKHWKSRHFSEKESFNLLTDGMTDIVKTHLYNTPILRKTADGWKTTGDYLWQGDIEPLVLSVRGASSTEEVATKLRESGNPAAQSVYMRLFHDAPYKLDGKQVWSIGKIQHPEVFKMTDAIAQYILSGNIFNLTKVDFEEGELKASLSSFSSPNTVRQSSHDAVILVGETTGKFILPGEKGSLIIGPLAVHPSSERVPSDKDVLDAIHAIGLVNFSEQNLKDIQELDYRKLNVQPGLGLGSKVNSAIVDNIILPTMYKMKDGKLRGNGSAFSRLNVLYDSIIRSSGSANVMMDTGVDGNKRSRLQWGGPIYRINTQLEEVRAEANSVLADNLLVNRRYVIRETRIKGGFKSENAKSSDRLSGGEVADFDMIWAFTHTLKQSHADTGQYLSAMLTPLVWSDSKTDPHMVVDNPKGYFRPHVEILSDLYNSRQSYYSRQSGKILANWNNLLEKRRPGSPHFSSLSELSTWLSSNPAPIAEVAAFPGMVNNLDYFKQGDQAIIKPSLIEDVQYYTGHNLSDFIKKTQSHYTELLAYSKGEFSADGEFLYDRLGKVIDGKSGDDILKAFYYNWLAFSSEFQHLTAGNIHQYKTNDLSSEFIDSVKRNKLHMANRTSQLFRNQSWDALWRQAKTPLSPEMLYEGKKLPRYGKVAYVYDVKKALSLPSGLTKDQEVYDGATFVMPTTRIMQTHSNSGSHGMYVGAVMKNVTTTYDNSRGIPAGIKNAEFLLTPELMRQGTPLVQSIVRRVYSNPFAQPVMHEGKMITSAWQYLTESLGLKENLSNADWKQFDDLLTFLVSNNEQDSLILEVAPDSSVKMGRKATNPLLGEEPFVTETIDLVNKGTQLDASHGIDEISGVRASQIVNAISYNFTSPKDSLRMLRGLAEIAYAKVIEWRDKTPLQRKQALKDLAVQAFANRNDVSYATKLTSPSNGMAFSIDDRQLVTPIIQSLNSKLSNEAILLDFDGGQFIVHPTSGLIHVYDVVRDGQPMTVLKNELLPEETNTLGRDLKWDNNGRAEILLPASMRKKFGILPGTPLSEITPEYFAEKVLKDASQMRKATLMYQGFKKTLDHIVTRIPATGKHSAVSAKIVGFVDESENSVFVPAELMFNQGADQDADKGTNFSYEVVNNLVPEVDEGFDLKGKSMFPDKMRKRAIIAGIKNAVVKAMDNIMTSAETLIERNTPVDVSKGELEELAAHAEAQYRFDPDSYISHLRMRDINQSGMALRGLFSNSMKAYQILCSSAYSKDIDPVTGHSLSSMSPEQLKESTATVIKTSERIGALVNAAVDNAKDQLMGKLGITIDNANIVSYLVMKGHDFKTVVGILNKYRPQLNELARYKRYDSTSAFRASVTWAAHPDLASVYYLGREAGQIAVFAINRRLPSSDSDMIAYRKRVESFVNGQYKAFNLPVNFNLINFLSDVDYADSQIAKYESLKGKEVKGIRRSEFNILRTLKDSPHIWSYLQVYLLSHNLASESKLYSTSSKLADEVAKTTSQLDDNLFHDIKEFTYGLFIDRYLQKADDPTGFSLATPRGRQKFASHVASDTFLNPLRIKYPANSFINGLTVVPDKKYHWKDTTLLRLAQDIQQTSEERRMQLAADFHNLDADDRRLFVLYNLITRHGRFGKDSYGALFEPSDKADLNRFLDERLNINLSTEASLQELSSKFGQFRAGESGDISHNIIPYTLGEEKLATAVQIAASPTIDQDTAEMLSRLSGRDDISTTTSEGDINSLIDSLLSDRGLLNQMEFAYLTGLKEQIEVKRSAAFNNVDEKVKSCAP